jgi:hypothetical protein
VLTAGPGENSGDMLDRRMRHKKDPEAFLRYQLYVDAARTRILGDGTRGTDVLVFPFTNRTGHVYAEMPGVGAAGPALVHPDGRVSVAGFAIGLDDPAAPVMRGFDADSDGYYGSLACAREVSAIGMGCLLVSRSDFERVGGFEETYSRQFQDIDLCLKLRDLGRSVVCAPTPRTIDHTTEAQRRSDFDVLDRALFVDRWYERLAAGDPYYGRGFSREAADYRLPPFAGDPLEIAMREAAR